MKILDPKMTDVARDDVHLSKSFKGNQLYKIKVNLIFYKLS